MLVQFAENNFEGCINNDVSPSRETSYHWKLFFVLERNYFSEVDDDNFEVEARSYIYFWLILLI